VERYGESELQSGQQRCIEGFEHSDHLALDILP
jgi:hypothetical protein